jgi:hypothetical protein
MRDLIYKSKLISLVFLSLLIIVIFSNTVVKPTTVEKTDILPNYVGTSQKYIVVLNFTINTTNDIVLAGKTPNIGQVLENDDQSLYWGGVGKMRYYDNSTGPLNGDWNASIDSIFLEDIDNNGQYDTGESIIAGITPINGTTATGLGCKNISSWNRVKSYDASDGGKWDSINDSIIFEGIDINLCYLDQLNAITFNLSNDCNATYSDINDLTLWIENRIAGGFQSNENKDTLLSNVSYSTNSNSWNISNLNQDINISETFYVAINISDTAIHHNTIKMQIPTFYDANSNGSYDNGDKGLFLKGTTNDTGNIENQYNITIDINPPESSIDTIENNWYDTQPLTINATASDSLSGVNGVTLYWFYSSDNVTWFGPFSNGTITSEPYSWDFMMILFVVLIMLILLLVLMILVCIGKILQSWLLMLLLLIL